MFFLFNSFFCHDNLSIFFIESIVKSINDTLQFWGTLYEDPTKLGRYDF